MGLYIICKPEHGHNQLTKHLALRGAENVQTFCGVILKSERPSGALFTNSGLPNFNYKHKIEGLF